MKFLSARDAWRAYNDEPGSLASKLRAVQRAFAKLNGLVE